MNRTWARIVRGAAATLTLAVIGGCVATTIATSRPAQVSSPPSVAAPPAATTPPTVTTRLAASGIVPTAPATVPPVASLAVEGGDPVAGELGSYTWDGAGSDGPWLAGARISLGAGEPIQVTVAGDPSVSAWRARIAAASEGSTPRTLATGPGPVRFVAPAAGDWTVELTVEVPGSGSVTWYWELEVS